MMKCSNHPEVDAGWQCVACRKSFCENCIKMIGGRSEQVAVCPVCGEKCEQVTFTQTERGIVSQGPSFWERLPWIVIYPLEKDGLVILIVGAIFFTIADFAARWAFIIGIFVWLFAMGYLCRYFLSVVSESAEGRSSPPGWPDFEPGSSVSAGFSALLKFISPAILSYASAACYYFFGPKKLDDLFGVLVVAGSLYYPMGLTAVAVFDDLSALNPVAIIRSAFRVPLKYVATCIIFMLLLYLNYLRQKHLIIHVPILGALLRWFILLYLWTMAMHLLGMFYYTNRHKLQWT
jgi:hypothetical protein